VSQSKSMRFCFVGERPSPRAEQIGATWQNAKLAGKTLRDTLMALGLDPEQQSYCNLWPRAEPTEHDDYHLNAVIDALIWIADRVVIVAMGTRVSRELRRVGLEHVTIVHPAARGAIRRTERYQAHVAERLGEHLSGEVPA
jgi:uracil-DNA glycosylase